MVEFTMENIQVFGEQYSLECVLLIGTRSGQSIMASGFTAAQTGRTHDRTRPMLQQLRKFLPRRLRPRTLKRNPGVLQPSLARSANKRLIEYRELLLGSLQIHRHNVILPTVKDD